MSLTNAAVPQTNSDAGTDVPATWRSDINTGVTYLNQLLAHFAGPETDIASAATMDIGAGAANRRRVTGTTTVTSLGTAYAAGFVLLRCAAATPFTHNATTLICPGGASFTAVAGDLLLAIAKGTAGTPDGWTLVLLQRAASVPFTLSAFMATVLDDANAAAARATLGVPDAAVGANALCNGDMGLRQRGNAVGITCPVGVRTYHLDRWAVTPAGAGITQAQSSTLPAGSRARYSLELTGAASVTTVDVDQRVEAAEIPRIKRQVTFSFAVHNVTGAAFTPSLLLGTPAAADDFTTVTNRLTQVLASCPNAAWTTVSHTVDISLYTNIDNGLEVKLRLPSGVLVAGDVVRVTEAQVRAASAFVAFEPEPIQLALDRCFRFFQASVFGYVGYADSIGLVMKEWVACAKPMLRAPTGTLISQAAFASEDFNYSGLSVDAARTDCVRLAWTANSIGLVNVARILWLDGEL